MSQKSSALAAKLPAEKVVRDIRRATRKHHSAEDKIRIVLEGLRGKESIAALCRRETIAAMRWRMPRHADRGVPFACRLTAWPLSGLQDLAEFDARLLTGTGPTIAPRLADVPVRVPLPPARHQGSIYENQLGVEGRSWFGRRTAA